MTVYNPGAIAVKTQVQTILAGSWIPDSGAVHGLLRCNCPEMRRTGTAVSLR
jgi:hypothetical protein